MIKDAERLLMRGNTGASQLEKKMVEYWQDLTWATEVFQVSRSASFSFSALITLHTADKPKVGGREGRWI
jgi:hypothetical protein